MKVRCIQVVDSMGHAALTSAWVKIGSIYHVLGISIEATQARLRIVGEEPTPALLQLQMFEVVSPVIPSVWIASSPTPGCLSLGPAPWSKPGFWEKFFDRDPEAVTCFEEQRGLVIASDP